MATATFSAPGNSSTVAAFRAWGLALSDALTAVGLLKTADTGQIDWATVPVPSGTNVKSGYEVRVFADALQATAPLFFRIDYGGGTGTNAPGIWLTVGKGSNGTGSITNVVVPEQTFHCGTPGGVTGNSYVSSGDASMLAMSLWAGTNANTAIIDRSRDKNGAATAVGVQFARKTQANAMLQLPYNYLTTTAAPSNNTAIWAASVPAAASTGLAFGGLAPLFPAITTDGAGTYWQPRALLSYAPLDGGIGSPIDVPGWGRYLPTGHPGWGTPSTVACAAIAWY